MPMFILHFLFHLPPHQISIKRLSLLLLANKNQEQEQHQHLEKHIRMASQMLSSPLMVLIFCGVLMAMEVSAMTQVKGNVFCDHCRDGKRNFFDWGISGVSVALKCGEEGWEMDTTTDFLGDFTFNIDGMPDLRGCRVAVTRSSPSNSCNNIASGEAALTQTMDFFFYQLYKVDFTALYLQPGFQDVSQSCKNRGLPGFTPAPTKPPPTSTPTIRPPPSFSPVQNASACTPQYWLEYSCQWKIVRPNTPVFVALGLEAGRKYGATMNMRDALLGRGDLYRVLLREASACLLNAYASPGFRYNVVDVVYLFSSTMRGSKEDALKTAMRFRRANAAGPCLLQRCPAS